MDNDTIIDIVSKAIETFDGLDLNDPLIRTGLNSVAALAMENIFKVYTNGGFDSDVFVGFDPKPYLRISWWDTMCGIGSEIIFRFQPLHAENKKENDLIAAYDRAMKVL